MTVSRTVRTAVTAVLGVLLAVAATMTGSAVPAAAAASDTWTAPNPILGDGSNYSADPATLVVGNQLIVYTGHDEADPTTNDFIMNNWQAFSTTNPATGPWTPHPNLMRPETVFAWANPGRAYAGQVVIGPDGRYYWFVPVTQRNPGSSDPFAIGVAVSTNPYGPYTDLIGRPIVSQAISGNTAQNIDPTVIVEGTKVTMYWGTFGRLFRARLTPDMAAVSGAITEVPQPPGYFEAPWIFARNGSYYLVYAANNVDATCTPAVYHACIAYASSSSVDGPWTYQGRLLAPVSSTTSHPAVTAFGDDWVLAYHTADAVGGNHFRRSVAVDRVEWDDTQTPPRMLPVTTTPIAAPNATAQTNIAGSAVSSSSNQPVPAQYWIKALNDGIVRPNPLPPDYWGNYSGNRPAQEWVEYDWPVPVTLSSSAVTFFQDSPPGTGNGVSVPKSWQLQYWTGTAWSPVANPSAYGTALGAPQNVTFTAVSTTRLRAVLNAAPSTATPTTYSALGVQEWTANAPNPTLLPPADVVRYPFDQNAGRTTQDVAGRGYNGVLSGSYSWTTGHSGKAVRLAGGYVQLPRSILAGANDFTVAAWVRPDTNATWSRIFDFGSGTGSYMFLTPNSGAGTTRYAITTNGYSTEQILNAPALPVGVWSHVAVTQSGNTAILYLNGAEVARNTGVTVHPGALGVTTQDWIGRSQYGNDPGFAGAVDEFRVHGRALSAAEIKAVYQS